VFANLSCYARTILLIAAKPARQAGKTLALPAVAQILPGSQNLLGQTLWQALQALPVQSSSSSSIALLRLVGRLGPSSIRQLSVCIIQARSLRCIPFPSYLGDIDLTQRLLRDCATSDVALLLGTPSGLAIHDASMPKSIEGMFRVLAAWRDRCYDDCGMRLSTAEAATQKLREPVAPKGHKLCPRSSSPNTLLQRSK
jgi:hypothetical protein